MAKAVERSSDATENQESNETQDTSKMSIFDEMMLGDVMFVVRNLTKSRVVISDLGNINMGTSVEPLAVVDLCSVAPVSSIKKSALLVSAIRNNILEYIPTDTIEQKKEARVALDKSKAELDASVANAEIEQVIARLQSTASRSMLNTVINQPPMLPNGKANPKYHERVHKAAAARLRELESQ